MRLVIVVAVVAAVCAHAAPATASEWKRIPAVPDDASVVMRTMPVFSQVIVFQSPATWKLAHERTAQGQYIAEFIPNDQTLDAWSEMITVQGFRDLARNPQATPAALLAVLADGIGRACPADAVVHSTGGMKVDSFDAHTAVLGCASFPRPMAGAQVGQGEIAYYVAIRGADDIYVIHRAWRGPAFDRRSPPMSPATAPEILRSLQPIKICERSEPAPLCRERKPR